MMIELTRILYVEDEPDIQAIARLALQSVGGFTVKICSSGQEALKEVDVFQPQLILLDVMMPDMDGPSTLKALQQKEMFQRTPVVFVTAKVRSSEVEQLKALGAADVIPKPFDPMALSDQIRDVWRRSFL